MVSGRTDYAFVDRAARAVKIIQVSNPINLPSLVLYRNFQDSRLSNALAQIGDKFSTSNVSAYLSLFYIDCYRTDTVDKLLRSLARGEMR